MQGPSPARSFANLIILIGLISAGIATFMAMAGEAVQGLYVCGGGLGLAVLILLLGSWVVAANKDDSE